MTEIGARLDTVDWQAAEIDLDARGWTRLPGLLDRHECDAAAALYDGRRAGMAL